MSFTCVTYVFKKGETCFLMNGPSSDLPSSQGVSAGDGDNRKDTSNQSCRKQPLLLQSSRLIFHQSTHIYTLPAPLIFPKELRG